MKCIVSICCFLILLNSGKTQEIEATELKNKLNAFTKELELTQEQKHKILAIDIAYLNDMKGIKDRAESGYNPPKHIQYQHSYILIRQLLALKKVLSADQFIKIQEMRYDIYPYQNWLAAFYKKNKLPTIKQAVEKKMGQLKSND